MAGIGQTLTLVVAQALPRDADTPCMLLLLHQKLPLKKKHWALFSAAAIQTAGTRKKETSTDTLSLLLLLLLLRAAVYVPSPAGPLDRMRMPKGSRSLKRRSPREQCVRLICVMLCVCVCACMRVCVCARCSRSPGRELPEEQHVQLALGLVPWEGFARGTARAAGQRDGHGCSPAVCGGHPKWEDALQAHVAHAVP
eukprot:1161472-Pelagomonas_calceolata.AAC.6